MCLILRYLTAIREPVPIVGATFGVLDRRRPETTDEPDRSSSTEAVENPVEERVVRGRTIRSMRTGLAICTIAVRTSGRIVSPRIECPSGRGARERMHAPTGPARRRDMVPEGKGGPRVAHGGDTRDGMRQMDGLTMGNLSCGYFCTGTRASSLAAPLVRDRLWFHGAYRNWGLKLLPANTFYDRDPADYVFEPDESRPGVDEQYDDQSASLRLTWQATDQNKFALYYNGAPRHRPYQGILAGPERRLLPGRERAGAVLERQLRAERHHELLRRRRHVGIRRPPQQLGVLAPGSSRRSCPGRPWTWRTGGACRATSR